MNTPSTNRKLISVICPVFNEHRTIPLFYERFQKVWQNLPDFSYQLIFTNNRSTDGSLEAIREIQKKDPAVQYLTFSRNFGYQASILAGVTYAQGDAVVIIDVDCEDPPELIPVFIEKWLSGNDICYGIRQRRPESAWITWMRRLFYRILKFTADTDIILDMAEFSLLSSHVRDVLIKNTNTFPFLRAEIAYSGFRKVGIPYDRQKRIIGQSNYNFKGMFLFAVAGILSVSTFPLRLPVYFLPVMILINLLGIILDYADVVSAFKGLIILDFLYFMTMMTAQGLYIARIYKNGIGRPVYVIDWELSDRTLFKTDPLKTGNSL